MRMDLTALELRALDATAMASARAAGRAPLVPYGGVVPLPEHTASSAARADTAPASAAARAAAAAGMATRPARGGGTLGVVEGPLWLQPLAGKRDIKRAF